MFPTLMCDRRRSCGRAAWQAHCVRPGRWRHHLQYVPCIPTRPFRGLTCTQDVVKIFRTGEPERSARLAPESKSELRVQFYSDDDEALRLYDLARVLLVLKRDYWWYFWLNSQKWSWPYTACKNLCAWRGATIEKIEVGDLEGPLGSAEETSEFLKESCEGWKHAELRKYCKLSFQSDHCDLMFLLFQIRGKGSQAERI